MSEYVVTPQPLVSLPVQGCEQRFPVGRVFCLGRNYWWPDVPLEARSVREMPGFFMKPASAVVDAQGSLRYPSLTEEFCPEIELVIALGKDANAVPVNAALECVFGYAAGLDMTRRDLQLAAKAVGQPWESAKAFDASAPISSIVPVSAIGHPEQGALWLQVNGQARQRADLNEQICSVAEIISHLSHSLQLKAGDLIMTGTPTGVAGIQPGDEVSAGIDGIGELQMTVVR